MQLFMDEAGDPVPHTGSAEMSLEYTEILFDIINDLRACERRGALRRGPAASGISWEQDVDFQGHGLREIIHDARREQRSIRNEEGVDSISTLFEPHNDNQTRSGLHVRLVDEESTRNVPTASCGCARTLEEDG